MAGQGHQTSNEQPPATQSPADSRFRRAPLGHPHHRAARMVGLYAQNAGGAGGRWQRRRWQRRPLLSRQHLPFLALLIPDQVLRVLLRRHWPGCLLRSGTVNSFLEHHAPAQPKFSDKIRCKSSGCRCCRPALQRRFAWPRTASKLPGGDIFLDLLSRVACEAAPAGHASSNQNCGYSRKRRGPICTRSRLRLDKWGRINPVLACRC